MIGYDRKEGGGRKEKTADDVGFFFIFFFPRRGLAGSLPGGGGVLSRYIHLDKREGMGGTSLEQNTWMYCSSFF